MLVISRKAGESFFVNDQVEIRVLEIGQDKIKIGIEAPREISVVRKELKDTKETNREAVKSRGTADYRELLKLAAKK